MLAVKNLGEILHRMAFREPHKEQTETEARAKSTETKCSKGRSPGVNAGGGRLVVQIIHIADTDSSTNKLGSSSRET